MNLDNLEIYGFYDPCCLDLEEATLLQTIYLSNGKYYVVYDKSDFFHRLLDQIDILIERFKGNRDKYYYEVSEFISHFHEGINKVLEYYFQEIDITCVHNLIKVNDIVLKKTDFKLDTTTYKAAVVLSDGVIAFGDKEYLEDLINDSVSDKKRRLELLEELYYTYYDYESRQEVINDYCFEYYNELDDFLKKEWDNKKNENYLILYAFSLINANDSHFYEVIDDKKYSL